MTPNEFCLWLQGYVELGGGTPTDAQWVVIKDHLQLVMDKKTPVRNTNVEMRLTDMLKQNMPAVPPVFGPQPINPEQIKISC